MYRVSQGGTFRVKKTRDKLQTDDSITPYKDAQVLLPTLRCYDDAVYLTESFSYFAN